MGTELIDVTTTRKFTIAEFKGRPVVLHIFSVKSKESEAQQKVLNGLELQGDSGPVIIAIDTDPKDDPTLVINMVSNRGNQGLYAVASEEMTKQLIEDFGEDVNTYKSSPILVIGAGQETLKLLPSGVKSLADLQTALTVAN